MAYKGRIWEETPEYQAADCELLPYDGCFMPAEKNRIDTSAKLIAMFSGGPAASMIIVTVLLMVKLGGISLYSGVIATDAI